MNARTHDWLLLAAALAIGGYAFELSHAPAAARHVPGSSRPRIDAFPPAPPRPAARAAPLRSPRMDDADLEIRRLGHQATPVHSAAAILEAASDWRQFVLERLPLAAGGDGESEYLIYLALEQCRTYLRMDAQAALELSERMLADFEDLSTEERRDWQWEYRRCRGFAAEDWSAVGMALGADRPGAETEYASVFFERAADARYAPALIEQALRPGPLGREQRVAQLQEGAASQSADADWLMFAHSSDVETGAASAPSVAWLIAACRAGYDCGEQARWYRAYVCQRDGMGCQPGESALEHYWYSLPVHQRGPAYRLAGDIESAIEQGRWQDLPLPEPPASTQAGGREDPDGGSPLADAAIPDAPIDQSAQDGAIGGTIDGE